MSLGCVFCAIVAGEAEASFVAQSERAVAFLDIDPIGEGHALVVPRQHAVGLGDLDDDDGAAMFRLGRRIAAAQRALGLADGVNLFLADGEAAGQEVFHAHLHVLARKRADGCVLTVDRKAPPARDQLETTAAGLREALPL